MNKMFALVKWCGGVYDKTYTSEIPIEWIRDFNEKTFEEDRLQTYAIEWHDTHKAPKGGWKLYNGYIVAVSDKKSTLNKTLSICEGDSQIQNRLSLKKSDKETSPISRCAKGLEPSTSILKEKNQEVNLSKNLNKKKNAKPQDKKPEIINMVGYEDEDKSDLNLFIAGSDTIAPEVNGESSIGEISKKLDVMQKSISALSETIAYMFDAISKIQKKLDESTSKDISPPPNKSGGFHVGQVELGISGSGVKVDELEWMSAISRNNAIGMVKALLPCLFKIDVLLEINYKGGAPKNKLGQNISAKKRLDPKILDALKYSVNKIFPGKITDAEFGQAVNSKITSLRFRASEKKKKKICLPLLKTFRIHCKSILNKSIVNLF